MNEVRVVPDTTRFTERIREVLAAMPPQDPRDVLIRQPISDQ